jgi:tungstate transport system permease protein
LAFREALTLIATFDGEVFAIVALSLRVSLSAAALAFLLALPLAGLLAMREFPGRRGVLVTANALQGLPPVLVGLVLYLLLSRSGPLGPLGLLFTPAGMILAQLVLVLPIFVALLHRQFEAGWREVGDLLRMDGARLSGALLLLATMGRAGLATVFLTGFGRAIAEVGAIMIVGGNIRGQTRTMTTAIALETSKGDLPLALALGLVLVGLTFLVSLGAFLLARASRA